METLLLYLAVGAFAGLLAGLFGVGGGVVIVPALAFSFTAQGMNPEVLMHVAVGTSLATIVVTSLSSIRAHHRRGAVLWPVFLRLTPGIIVGAFIGAAVADLLPGEWLRRIFALFILFVAVQLAFGLRPAPNRSLPGTAGMALAGAVIGSVSAIVGIGGGSLTVPFLTWCNVHVRNAVATSAAGGFPIAVAGALGFLYQGWGAAGLPEWSSGYLYWPAFAGIVVASTSMAPLGARLAHTLPAATLKRIFALLLAVIGVRMLLG